MWVGPARRSPTALPVTSDSCACPGVQEMLTPQCTDNRVLHWEGVGTTTLR